MRHVSVPAPRTPPPIPRPARCVSCRVPWETINPRCETCIHRAYKATLDLIEALTWDYGYNYSEQLELTGDVSKSIIEKGILNMEAEAPRADLAVDPVNPHHYDPIFFVGLEKHISKMPYFAGAALKYLWRAPSKNGVEDLDKARKCLQLHLQYAMWTRERPTPGVAGLIVEMDHEWKKYLADDKVYPLRKAQLRALLTAAKWLAGHDAEPSHAINEYQAALRGA